MKRFHLPFSLACAVVALGLAAVARAQPEPSNPPPPPDEVATPPPAAETDGELRRLDEPTVDETPVEAAPAVPQAPAAPEPQPASGGRRHAGELVRFGTDALLPRGEEAREVVAIFGDVIADGTVHGSSVAIMGDNTTNGSAREVVAVFGNVVVNGHVREVVAVMGSVQLGPNAIVDREVVCVGGRVDRAPGAQVHGPINQVGPFPVVADGLQGLRTWFRTCLLLGRPLAWHPDVLWAWGIAFAFFGVYLFLALVFNRAVIISAETLERRPGMTIVTAIIAALLGPLLVILLSAIGVGLVLIPLLFLAGLFGKTAFLAWLGRRITLPLGLSHTFFAVLLGGIILLLLYTVPFLGFLMMKVSSGLGLGMALYAAFLATRPKPGALPPAATASGSGIPPSTAAAASVSPASGFSAAPVPAVDEPLSTPPSSSLPPPTPLVPPAPSFAPPTPPVLPTPLQLSTLPRAGFWIRIAASVIDLILVAIVLNVVNIERFWPVLFGAYCATLWALRGTTVGGIICGLKVTRLDDRPLDWPVAIVRALGGFLSAAVLGLGFVWVAFDPERQSWHDKIAGTTVVRVPKGVALV